MTKENDKCAISANKETYQEGIYEYETYCGGTFNADSHDVSEFTNCPYCGRDR